MTARPPPSSEERLVSGYSGRLLGITAFITMLAFTGQLAISPLLPAIIDDLSITSSDAGFALTTMWILYSVVRFPGGRLADRLSHKTVILASVVLLIVGYLVLMGSFTFGVFLLAVGVVGLGRGFYMPAAVALISEVFTDRRGGALGVHETFINLGGVLGGVLAVAALAVASWNVAFAPVVGLLALGGIVMHIWNKQSYVLTASKITFDLRDTGIRLAKSWRVRAVLAAYTLFVFAWQGVTAFLPTFLQFEQGFSPTLAGQAFTGVFVVGVVANLVLPRFSDRLGYVQMAGVAALLGALGLGVVIVAGSTAVVLMGVFVLSIGLTIFWPVMTSYLVGLFKQGNVGGDFGAISTVYLGLGSLGPAYVGVMADWADYNVAFGGLAACLLVSVGVCGWLALRG